jgi:hypothetical protein
VHSSLCLAMSLSHGGVSFFPRALFLHGSGGWRHREIHLRERGRQFIRPKHVIEGAGNAGATSGQLLVILEIIRNDQNRGL